MSNTLEHFFTGKFFRIPNYQRDYSWGIENIDDLLDDIIESIETSTNHYIGTFILAKTNDAQQYNVVDGQQRLTSLTMILSIAIRELADNTGKIIYEDKFIKSSGNWKLQLLNDNSLYLQKMFNGENPEPETKSQQLLMQALFLDHLVEKLFQGKINFDSQESHYYIQFCLRTLSHYKILLEILC